MMRGFYVIIFAFVPIILARVPNADKKLGFYWESFNTCLTETNTNENDIFTKEDIINDSYKQSEDQEKLRKNGCFIQCLYQKKGFMQDSEFNMDNVDKYLKKKNAQPEDSFYKVMVNCIEKGKDIADKCEKSFNVTTCFIKAEHLSERDQHTSEEHK